MDALYLNVQKIGHMQQEVELYHHVIKHLNPRVSPEEWAYFEAGFEFL